MTYRMQCEEVRRLGGPRCLSTRSLADQILLLNEGAGKNRATSVGSWRKVAIAIAALQ